MKKILNFKNIFIIVEIFLMTYWLTALLKSDSYYIVYLVTGVLSFIGLYIKFREKSKEISTKNNIIFLVTSTIYAFTVILANYKILNSWVKLVLVALGSFFAFYNILRYVILNLDKYKIESEQNKNNTWKVFIIVAITILVFYSIFLIFAYYPGILTNDSINQLKQIQTGKYSNHHPFFHTMLIKFCIDIGMNLLKNINSAVMLYSLFQVSLVSLTIAYCITTLYQMKIPKKYLLMGLLFYLLMPYNIMYSFTMWKDIIFALSVLIFIVSLYRIIKEIGKRQILNYILIFLSSIGIMLFRSNGILALIMTFIFMIFVFIKSNKKLLVIVLAAIIISGVLKGPVLKAFNIRNPDFVESLSIPLQQVARVITDNKKISEEQYEKLSKIVEVKNIPEKYKNYISDPIKMEIRNYGNQEYLVENKIEYLKLYAHLGMKYPMEYIYAWADQTKGYWNGGYKYWIWSTNIAKNDLGLQRTTNLNIIRNMIEKYMDLFDNGNVFSLFVSIGFNTWILLLLFVYNLINKRKETILFLPIIFLIGTLLIATPVYSEFRYIYAMFISLPFLVFASLKDS